MRLTKKRRRRRNKFDNCCGGKDPRNFAEVVMCDGIRDRNFLLTQAV